MAAFHMHYYARVVVCVIFLTSLLPFIKSSSPSATVKNEEVEALIHWKKSLSSSSSSSASLLSSWSFANLTNFCNWSGIVCTTSGTVSEINVSASNLIGTLAQFSFASFPNLIHLDLSQNQLSGPIPAEVGNLKGLLRLVLRTNQLSGPIPHTIGNLINLKYLNLNNNSLYGPIPLEIGNLKGLQDLEISQNLLSGPIPTTIGNLTNLTVLYLANNSLSGSIPVEIGNLKRLQYIGLYINQLSGPIPQTIGDLVNLRTIYLGVNNLSGLIPPTIHNLSSLHILDLHHNFLHGPLLIPPITTVFYHVTNNHLSGNILPSICNLSSLVVLSLDNNIFSGVLPQCLGNFSRELLMLDLQFNQFHGSIPATFAKESKLRSLYLNDNQLEGPVHQAFINCRKLEIVNLGNNMISDKFPHWMDTLPELKVLSLRSNRFYGTIGTSSTIIPFSKLQILDISGNHFTGLLPERYFKSFKGMMNIDEHNATMAYIEEVVSLPDVLSSTFRDTVELMLKGYDRKLNQIFNLFTAIDLSNNKFEGGISNSIGMLNSLRYLNLSHNNLGGPIPAALSNLTVLEHLDLSSNKFIGEIPRQLTKMTSLEIMNLSQNQLTGVIPQGGQFNTFGNDSYQGNLDLCGFPLTKECSGDEAPSQQPREENDSSFFNGFTWESVVLGYGCGVLLGLGIGYLIFLTGTPKWVVRLVEGELYRRPIRPRKRAQTRGQGRRRN